MTNHDHRPDHDCNPNASCDPLALSELIAAGNINIVPGDPPGDIDAVPGNPPTPTSVRGVADTCTGAHPESAPADGVGNMQHGDPVAAQSPQDTQSNGESRYRADPDQAPLKIRIELRLTDGPEGKTLRARQAAAIRESLRWFAARRDQEQAGPRRPTRRGHLEHPYVAVRPLPWRSFPRHRPNEPLERAWPCGARRRPFSSRTPRRPDVPAARYGKRILH